MIVCVNEGNKELVVKKSRFIAISKRIETRDDVKAFADGLKAKHPDARHVCYAYIADEKGDDFGYDDNGEPSGTAGKPIYSAIAAANARKTCIAVVRYFGGIKLGAGGLTRAYRQSAAELIAAVGTFTAGRNAVYSAVCDGDAYKKAAALIRNMGGTVEGLLYQADVRFKAVVPTEREAELADALAALNVKCEKTEERYSAV